MPAAALCTLGSVTVPSLASVFNEFALKKHMDTSVHEQVGTCTSCWRIFVVFQRQAVLNFQTYPCLPSWQTFSNSPAPFGLPSCMCMRGYHIRHGIQGMHASHLSLVCRAQNFFLYFSGILFNLLGVFAVMATSRLSWAAVFQGHSKVLVFGHRGCAGGLQHHDPVQRHE